MDLAASIQAVTEEIVLRLTRSAAQRRPGSENLCLAGGVALNCVANGKILRDGKFKNIWIQPAAGDAGGALGAALAAYHRSTDAAARADERSATPCSGSYLGPAFTQREIEQRPDSRRARVSSCSSDDELIDATARALADGKAVGWFQGRMEFGPRALGARSIIGDPRSPTMQRSLNLQGQISRELSSVRAGGAARGRRRLVRARRATAPTCCWSPTCVEQRRRAMTAEEQALFGIDKLNVPRSEIPAVTHVDYSARDPDRSRRDQSALPRAAVSFQATTGCPVLVNTSFNVRGEPIVCTPEDAFRCFMGTDIEVLAIGNCCAAQGRPGPGAQAGLQGHVRTGLMGYPACGSAFSVAASMNFSSHRNSAR